MAGDSPEVLQIILEENTLEKVWHMLTSLCLSIEICKNVVWFLTNVIGSKNFKGDLTLFIKMIAIIMGNNSFEPELFESVMLILDKIAKKEPPLELFESLLNEVSTILNKIIFYFNHEYEKMKDNTIASSLNFIQMFLMGKDEMIEVSKLI